MLIELQGSDVLVIPKAVYLGTFLRKRNWNRPHRECYRSMEQSFAPGSTLPKEEALLQVHVTID
jgi:hypothetical protein